MPSVSCGVMLAAMAVHPRLNGFTKTFAPRPICARSLLPMTSGVWQSMQCPTGPARYSPYLTRSVRGTSGTDVTVGPNPSSGMLYVLRGTSLRIAGTVFMKAAIARTSRSDMFRYHANDMGGPRFWPSGRLALRMALTMSSSDHEPMPVSMSGVMFGAYASKSVSPVGIFSVMTKAPEYERDRSSEPSWLCGVWQL